MKGLYQIFAVLFLIAEKNYFPQIAKEDLDGLK